MKQYLTFSEKETKNLAKKFAKKFKGHIIALSGALGAGKTTFVQGFAKGLGIKEKIISPSFVLIRQHKIASGSTMYHVDLYRLDEQKDISELGLKDLWSNPKNIVLIEWAAKVRSILPKNALQIKFKTAEGTKRRITIS